MAERRGISSFSVLLLMAVAAVVGYFTVRMMLRAITRLPLYWFSLYLAVLGLVYLLLQLTGSPMVPPFRPGV